MAERYNVRNVAQKEVYDSYMGILRISPNLHYNADEDDATDLLHTLVDFSGEYFSGEQNEDTKYQKESDRQIKVQLSDSDGNMLPIYFIPRAFTTDVTIIENENKSIQTKNIINICTWTNNSVFVSKKLDLRSTLNLKIKNPEEQKNKSIITIVSGGQRNTLENTSYANGILQYPIENPNDDDFFNKDNNRYCIDGNPNKFLFDPNDNTPRHEQMEANLYNQPLDWYKNVIENEIKRTGEDPHVIAAGKYVNTFNIHNEDVPVLYTRDYVLGHYEGHSIKGKDNIAGLKEEWIDSQTEAYDVSLDENAVFTKLSWIRIDKLIWDAIDEIISGKYRHNASGRYIDMGALTAKGTKIVKELFGIELPAELKGEEGKSVLSGKRTYGCLDETAPILGQGVQEGLIMYHAMPLHRYWFHRCRQILYNIERWKEMIANKYDVENISWRDYPDLIPEVGDILEAKDDNLITKACKASITPHHSLVKDFLFCNGQTVKFENYPNMSLTNTNLLQNDKQGKEAEPNEQLVFVNRESGDTSQTWTKGTFRAIQKSIPDSNDQYIKTPNLFAFNEAYPRFIRGLSWETNEEFINNKTAIIKDYNSLPHPSLEDYGRTLDANCNAYWIHSDKYKLDDDDELTEEAWEQIKGDTDIWGQSGVNIRKPIRKVALYHYNYDFASKVKNHQHLLFSARPGGKDNVPFYGKKFENLAAFYTWGSYGGVRFKVAPNESNGTRPHYYNGNEHGSNDFNYCATYCLALNCNYVNTTEVNGEAWSTYCLRPSNTNTFHDFTPVGNMGLLLWNGDLMNHDEENNIEYQGTTARIEQGNSDFFYTNYHSLNLRETDIKKRVTEIVNLSGVNFRIDDLKPDKHSAKLTYSECNKIRKDRFKRKQQAVKLNEAEGRIPISYIGHAKYRLEEGHMIERKRSFFSRVIGGDDYDTEPITVFKNKIGNYVLKGVKIPTISDSGTDTDKWGWCCLTSLPYEFPELLGYGDWRAITNDSYKKSHNVETKLSDPRKYYINHNVTDKWQKVQPEEKIREVNYGGKTIKADNQSPSPSHIYLLPLIRL